MQIILPKPAQELMLKFKHAGFLIYVVGGYVRDQLLKRKAATIGIDFATDATPEQMLKLFPKAKYENKFGTVVIPQGKHNYVEVTCFRSEKGYSDRRHPDKVTWGKTIEEDLKRRDFTVNALAYDGRQLIDLFAGRADLTNKVIRAIGNPNTRFKEDALRLMRAIRLSSELGFTIAPTTHEAIKKNCHLLKQISWERIRDELLKILASPSAADGVMLLKNTGLLAVFLPELLTAFTIDQISPKRHHLDDVGTHLLKSLEECVNPDPIVRLACLLHDIGKIKTRAVTKFGVVTFYNHEIVGTEMAYEIGTRLKLSKKQLTKLTKLVRYHQFTVTELQTDNAIRRFIRNVGQENLQDIVDLRIADRIGSGAKPSSWRTELFLKRLEAVQHKPFSVVDLKINGYDVMQTLKIKPGPKVGEILETVFQQVAANKLKNDRQTLLRALRTI